MDKRSYLHSFAYIGGTNTLWPMEFVTRKGKEINPPCLYIDEHFTDRLDRIGVK